MKKRRLILPSILAILAITSAFYVPRERDTVPGEQQWVDSVYNAMTEDERLGQLFMLRAHSDLGQDHIDKIKRLISEYKVGGLCFFQGTPEKQIELINEYQKLAGPVPLLIAIDAEWGLGMRMKESAISFPQQLMLGAIQDNRLIYEMGKEVAATTVELFGDLSADNPFFDQLDYMDADELPEYRAALNRIGQMRLEEISSADQKLILKLPFSYIESRNRLGLLDDELKSTIVEARRKLRETLEELETPPVSFYDPDRYNAAASVLDNVLLGRISSTVAEAPERVTNAIRKLLAEMELTDDIFRIGLEFNI